MAIKRMSGWAVAATVTLAMASGVATGAAGDVRLIQAVKQHNKTAVQSLLKQRIDVNATDVDGATALIWAAHEDDLASVQQLITAGANVNATSVYGVTPLVEAAGVGNAAMVKALLQAGANANVSVLEGGETPLMLAARTGSSEAVQALIERGANVNAKETQGGTTALMYAIEDDHAEVARLLLAHGADANIRTVYRNYKHHPTRAGSSTYIYANGGLTPIMFAARAGALETGRVLIEAGANLKVEEPDFHMTPLQVAIFNGNYQFGQLLVQNGASLTGSLAMLVEIRNLPKSTKLTIPGTKGSLELMKALIDKGADVHAALEYPMAAREAIYPAPPVPTTPLFRAAKAGDIEAMRLLVSAKGIDLNKGDDDDGSTPLMALLGVAERQGRGQVGEYDPKEPSNASRLEGIKLFIDHGVDVNTPNYAGDTAVHIAAERGRVSALQILADNHGDLKVENYASETPLQRAEQAAAARAKAAAAAPPVIEGHGPAEPVGVVETPEMAAALIRKLAK